MPKGSGRTGWPGNERTVHPIHIHTSKPELLQPGTVRATMPVESVLKSKVPRKEKRFNHQKKRGVR